MQKRINTLEVHRASFIEQAKDLYTSIPGYVLGFIPGTQRAHIQIGIQRIDVNGAIFTPPPIIDVVVQFPGSTMFTTEFQIDAGCEGMVHFSQRCIDGWKQTGGVAINPIGRFHDMQDAFFMPGGRSNANLISNFANNGIRLRNSDGTQYCWLKNDGSITSANSNCNFTQSANGQISLSNANGSAVLGADGTLTANGTKIDKNGNIIMKSGASFTSGNGVIFDTHKHTGVTTGSGTSAGPTN